MYNAACVPPASDAHWMAMITRPIVIIWECRLRNMKCNEKILKVTPKSRSKSTVTLSKNYSVTSKSTLKKNLLRYTIQVQESSSVTKYFYSVTSRHHPSKIMLRVPLNIIMTSNITRGLPEKQAWADQHLSRFGNVGNLTINMQHHHRLQEVLWRGMTSGHVVRVTDVQHLQSLFDC